MNKRIEVITEAMTKAHRFTATPETAVPCLECGAPVERGSVTHPRFMTCRPSCARRFTARMKAAKRDPAKVQQRAFRDAFGLARGTAEGQRQELPLLPDAEAMLLFATGTLKQVEPYRRERALFFNCG